MPPIAPQRGKSSASFSIRTNISYAADVVGPVAPSAARPSAATARGARTDRPAPVRPSARDWRAVAASAWSGTSAFSLPLCHTNCMMIAEFSVPRRNTMLPVAAFFLFVIIVGRLLLALLDASVKADMKRHEQRAQREQDRAERLAFNQLPRAAKRAWHKSHA